MLEVGGIHYFVGPHSGHHGPLGDHCGPLSGNEGESIGESVPEKRSSQIEGLTEAFNDPDCPVSTAYLPHGAEKTYRYLNTLKVRQFFYDELVDILKNIRRACEGTRKEQVSVLRLFSCSILFLTGRRVPLH